MIYNMYLQCLFLYKKTKLYDREGNFLLFLKSGKLSKTGKIQYIKVITLDLRFSGLYGAGACSNNTNVYTLLYAMQIK